MSSGSFFNRSGHDSPKIEAIKTALKKEASDTASDPDNQGILQGKSVPNVLANVPSVPGQKQLQKAQQTAGLENSAKNKSKVKPGGGSRSTSSDKNEDEDSSNNPPV